MWIEQLSIESFGPFENEEFGPLSPTVNVVGAPQCAGKTSLLDLLCRLVGEQPTASTSEDPPYVSWRIETDTGRYRYTMEGDAPPIVEPIGTAPGSRSHPKIEPDEYRQWCTITHSKLTASENERLAALLFDNLYGTIGRLPKIQTRLDETATEIGGAHGRAVNKLTDPSDRIGVGVDRRTRATEQVNRYEAVSTERDRLRERRRATTDTIEQLSELSTLLGIIRKCYADASTLTELEVQTETVDADQVKEFPRDMVPVLRERYERHEIARDRYESAKMAFQSAISRVNGTPTVKSVTNHSNELRTHCQKVPRLREQYEAFDVQRTALERERTQLRVAAASVNDDWYTDLDAIRTITTDAYARAEVQRIVSSYVEADTTHTEITHELALAERRHKHLESERSTTDLPPTADQLRRGRVITIGGTLSVLIIGSVGGVTLNPMVGVVLTAVGLLAVGLGTVRMNNTVESAMRSVAQLETSIRNTRTEIETLREQRAECENERDMARAAFESLVADLSLESLQPDAVLENYDRIVACKRRLRAYDERTDALERRRSTLRSTLETIGEDLLQASVIDATPEDPIESAPELLETLTATRTIIERASMVADRRDDLQSRRESVTELLDQHDPFPTPETTASDSITECVERIERQASTVQTMTPLFERADRCRDRITRRLSAASERSVLTDSHHVQEILGEATGVTDRSPVEIIQRLVEAFDSEATVSARKSQLEDRMNRLIEKNEARASRERTLERECSELSAASHIEAAARPIRAGRSQLRARSERYAINRLAALFLDELSESYVQQTAGPLLERSSDLFSRLTDGAYTGITLDESDATPRFLAVDDSGCSTEPTTLSNCTAALLYLSIRLAHSEDRSAPLVFDGAFAQFDPVHRRRALTVCANQFSDTQLFILSSQPTVINTCTEAFNECTFHALEEGSFSGPITASRVVDTLTRD
ncbi:AAA family ATPase [Halocatena halophila]|uniref:AAA family ATPase n=1 Tax=Halocatena halophila TaxID=2814576 RepID=UPI002ED1053D